MTGSPLAASIDASCGENDSQLGRVSKKPVRLAGGITGSGSFVQYDNKIARRDSNDTFAMLFMAFMAFEILLIIISKSENQSHEEPITNVVKAINYVAYRVLASARRFFGTT
jgi:hypothetical protein